MTIPAGDCELSVCCLLWRLLRGIPKAGATERPSNWCGECPWRKWFSSNQTAVACVTDGGDVDEDHNEVCRSEGGALMSNVGMQRWYATMRVEREFRVVGLMRRSGWYLVLSTKFPVVDRCEK